MHIFELAVMIAVCAGCAVGSHLLAKRHRRLILPLAVAGFVLLGLNLVSRLMMDRFYMLFPESFLTEVMYACSFVIAGVLSARYLDTSFRRIIFLVFVVVLSYFTLSDYVYFAVAAGRIKRLNGSVANGVTLQSSGFSCVAASLATVLRRWGLECSEGDVAYAARTSFNGTSIPRVPATVSYLGGPINLQAKIIRTDIEELLMLDVPCLLSTMWGRIHHSTALLGMEGDMIAIGEPQMGLVKMNMADFNREWKWNGYAVVIAPDFLHDLDVWDDSRRCLQLLDRLESLGYEGRDEETVKRFQSEHGLEPSGRLDWRTILVIDSLAGPAERPRLSTFFHGTEESSGE